MDMISENNFARLCGRPAGSTVYSHSSRDQDFYSFPLAVSRLSGTVDRVNVIVRPSQLALLESGEDVRLCVTGEVRSFNNRRGTGARLVITVFARELSLCQEEDSNRICLTGTLCKEPKLRCTPLGRDICDLMLAVNRPYGRSDYLPCICWGLRAREASLWPVGTRLRLDGRLQSREYIKLTEAGPIRRTAFEIAVTELERLSE